VNDEELKQRIKYLVEHGGLWDDPLDEIRRYAKTTRVLLLAALVMLAIDLFFSLV
jgi:alpha-mannosidase